MGIQNSWWAHLKSDAEKAERKEIVKASKLLREATKDVLEHKLKNLERVITSKSLYDNPNWTYLQADYVGYVRAIQEVIDLMTIEDSQ
ncbi:MAG TPA: hypothetical protein VIY48_10110 [Candidatus Paceibacterota bacterium]